MIANLIQFFMQRKNIASLQDIEAIAVLDENFSTSETPYFSSFKNITFITNRWDTCKSVREQGYTCLFNDFNFADLEQAFDVCFYRISKERAVCHHIFNQARSLLRDKGTLCVGGKKSEGAKGYHKKLMDIYQADTGVIKNGDEYYYLVTNDKANSEKNIPTPNNLDDQNYKDLREIDIHNLQFHTKPGLFGWNKIDAGSKFLMDTLAEDEGFNSKGYKRVLDLGCGYGYLSLRFLQNKKHIESTEALFATDNNAAAIEACAKNLAPFDHDLEICVRHSDCADDIEETFELILCNPPFHQGFDNERSLTHKFLRNASKRLSANGIAYYVVNSFIPIESLASDYLKHVSLIANNKQFKIIKAGKSVK